MRAFNLEASGWLVLTSTAGSSGTMTEGTTRSAAVLVNTSHPDAAGLKARIVRLFDYNRLFRTV